MPIQFPDFQRISFDEANPWLTGIARGQNLMQGFMQFPQDLQAKILANQIAQVKARYAEPLTHEELTKAQLYNKYYGPNIQSEIGLRGAQAGLAGEEAKKIQFLIKNPQYISPEGMLISQAIEQQKKDLEKAYQPQTLPQTTLPAPQQPQMNAQTQIPQSQMGVAGTPSTSQGEAQASQPFAAQFIQPKGPQYSQAQYHPDALAFNPPTLASPTGNSNLDSLYYKKFGMGPVMQAQLDLAQSQAQKYQTENIKRNQEFNNQSVFANESTLNAHKFLDALERSKSLERGFLGGQTPAISSAAQEMETYGANMASAATKLFQEGHAVHAADIALQQQAKPNRKQNEDVSFDLAQGVIAKNDRMKERQQFYSQGTQLGLKPEIMDAMWNRYETQRPYIDPVTKMPNDSFKGTWHDYLHPEVVNEFLRGKDYNLPNQKQLENANWNQKDLEKVQAWAKKRKLDPKDFSKKNLYKLAKSENLTLAELKQELRGLGAPL